MASLKEIKSRIASVEGTLKITSAMKMVASAKLHKAQAAIESMLPYDRLLHHIMVRLVSGDDVTVTSPFALEHTEVKRIAVVAIASNSSLCGGYNSNVLRHTLAALDDYAHETAASASAKGAQTEPVDCYVIGRKLEQSLAKQPGSFRLIGDFCDRGDNPTYATAETLARRLMHDYETGRIDRVEIIYMHFKSTASQQPMREVFLPIRMEEAKEATPQADTAGKHTLTPALEYIIEPSPAEAFATLLPDALCMKIYTCLLDAQAAEHAARTVAMQTATDNATDLLGDLSIMYNKGRQQAITSELLDIVGGSMQ